MIEVLVINSGKKSVAYQKGKFTIGKGKDASVQINNKFVSRSHLLVYNRGERIFFEDLNSSNGTFINGKLIAPRTSCEVTSEDIVTLGNEDVEVQFLICDEAQSENIKTPQGKKHSYNEQMFEETETVETAPPTPRAQHSRPTHTAERTPRRHRSEIIENNENIKEELDKIKLNAHEEALEIVTRGEEKAAKLNANAKEEIFEMEKEIKRLKEDLISVESKSENENFELNELKEIRDSIKQEVHDAREKLTETKEENEDVKKKTEELQNDSDRIKKEFSNKKKQIELSIKTKESEFELSRVQKKVEIEEMNSKKFVLEREIKQDEQSLEKLKDELKENKDKLEVTISDKRKSEDDITDLKSEIRQETNEFDAKKLDFKKELDDLAEETENSKDEQRAIFESLTKERLSLEDQIGSIKETLLEKKTQFDLDLKNKAETQQKEIDQTKDDAKTALNDARENAEKTIKEAQDKVENNDLEVDEIKANALKDAEEIIRDAREKAEKQSEEIDHLKIEAEHNAEQTLKGARDEAAKLQSDVITSKTDAEKDAEEILVTARAEAMKQADESRDFLDKSREDSLEKIKDELARMEADFEKRQEELANEMVEQKLIEEKKIQREIQGRLNEEERKKIQRSRAIVNSIGSALSARFISHGRKAIDTEFEKGVLGDVDYIVKSAMGINDDDKTTIKKILVEGSVSKQVKMFWIKVGVASVVGLFLLITPFAAPDFFPSIGRGMKSIFRVDNSASDMFLKKIIEERNKKPTFNPIQTDDFKNSYTDNILYTSDYMMIVIHDDFQRKWIPALDKFFQNKLNLSENSVIEFSRIEISIIYELIKARNTIKPINQFEKIAEMNKFEGTQIVRIQKLVGEINFPKYLEFQRDFYNSNRHLALKDLPKSETEDSVPDPSVDNEIDDEIESTIPSDEIDPEGDEIESTYSDDNNESLDASEAKP